MISIWKPQRQFIRKHKMIIPEHDRETHLLERRIELLEILDNILKRDIALGQPTDPESDEVKFIERQFPDVLNPHDLVKSLRDAYKDKPESWGSDTEN
jgi:hypothetical protein